MSLEPAVNGPTTGTPARRARRHDPDRVSRIADAAVAVIRRDGVLALTHRAVAREADVPLGSTTYHFSSIDELLRAALERISSDEVEVLDRWRSEWELPGQLEDALVDLLMRYTNERRAESILEYEVHMLAFRRPLLRRATVVWENAFRDLLEQHLDPVDAELVVAMFDGIILYGLGLDHPLSSDWARHALRKVLPPHV